MTVTLYHNPNCGTSRKVLVILRELNIEPAVIDYMKQPPTLAHWKALIKRSGLGVRAFLRTKEKLYGELDLANPQWTGAQLMAHLAEHPQLLNRPVVESTKGIRPCRPAEAVLELL